MAIPQTKDNACGQAKIVLRAHGGGRVCIRGAHVISAEADPIAVAAEQGKGRWYSCCAKYECLHQYPVPSTMSASMREALYPSGAKDDPRDTDLLLDLLLQHRELGRSSRAL